MALPRVFGEIRLAFAVPAYLFVSALCAFSVWRLLECKVQLGQHCPTEHKRLKLDDDSRGEHSEEEPLRPSGVPSDCGLGPIALVSAQTLGYPGLVLAAVGVLGSQLGFCIAYIGVVVETLMKPSLLEGVLTTLQLRIAVAAVLCALMLVRQLDSIAKLSGLALFIYAYEFAALLYFGGAEMREHGDAFRSSDWTPVRWSAFGEWFGTAIFAQEAIVIAQYVYDGMQLDSLRDFLPVLVISFGGCGVLCTFVGAFGFAAYGETIQDVFYLNFPPGSNTISSWALSAVLLMSFVLQMYPVTCFMESLVVGHAFIDDDDDESSGAESDLSYSSMEEAFCKAMGGRRKIGFLPSIALRFGLVLFCSLVSEGVPNLECATGYTGSLAVSLIGFVLPALAHIKLLRGRLSFMEWLQDGMLLVAGLAAVVFGFLQTDCSGA